MMITILFFAHLQEAVGNDSIQLEMEQTTVEQLKSELQEAIKSLDLNR